MSISEEDPSDSSAKPGLHRFDDPIRSGESTFKIFSFEPTTQATHDTEKCIDFWKFIDSRNLTPMPSFKLQDRDDERDGERDASTSRSGFSNESDNISWGQAMDLLKYYKLDKLARTADSNNATCKMCKQSCKELVRRRPAMETESDDEFEEVKFDLETLNHYNPQQKILVETSAMTDFIYTGDKETMTDMESPETIKQRQVQAELKKFDDFLEQLSGMYSMDEGDEPKTMEGDQSEPKTMGGYQPKSKTKKGDQRKSKTIKDEGVCICADPCVCIFKNARMSIDSETDFSLPKDKCTCSCGERNCLCREMEAILVEMEKANEKLEELSGLQVEKCPCSYESCKCLADYKELLQTKIEIKQYLRDNFGGSKLGLPMRCTCLCKQPNCPCAILINLLNEMDCIMKSGKSADGEPTVSERRDSDFEQDKICSCSELICTCMGVAKDDPDHRVLLQADEAKEHAQDCQYLTTDEIQGEISEVDFCMCNESGYKIKILYEGSNMIESLTPTLTNKFYVEHVRKRSSSSAEPKKEEQEEDRKFSDYSDYSLFGLCNDYSCPRDKVLNAIKEESALSNQDSTSTEYSIITAPEYNRMDDSVKMLHVCNCQKCGRNQN